MKGRDWATITEYIELLRPFEEATSLLQGRGKIGNHGAIWEVLITFEWLLDQLEEMKDRLSEVDYEDPDAPEDHLKTNVNLAHAKISEYYSKFDDAPVYYAATILHPHYKHHLEALWKVPEDWNEDKDGPHFRKDWLTTNHKGFLHLWKSYRDRAAAKASDGLSQETQRPPKRQRVGPSASRAAFLEHSMKATMKGVEQKIDDEYEIWKRQPVLDEDDKLSKNPIQYWLLMEKQFPILSRLALDIYSIPASSADCERTFSELGDLLGTRRLHIKVELMAALQCLKSWKRTGIKLPSSSPLTIELTDDDMACILEQLSQPDCN